MVIMAEDSPKPSQGKHDSGKSWTHSFLYAPICNALTHVYISWLTLALKIQVPMLQEVAFSESKKQMEEIYL